MSSFHRLDIVFDNTHGDMHTTKNAPSGPEEECLGPPQDTEQPTW